MNFNIPKKRISNSKNAFLSISIGTIAGLITYHLFLHFHIAIFGWNFGLVFAPLVAGYIETILARKIIGESIGAISAFILFIFTVIYSFILKNPTLGYNVITFGSLAVILQAALPTLINHFLFVVIIGILSYFLGIFKKITDYFNYFLKLIYHKITGKPQTHSLKESIEYDENLENIEINSLNTLFISSSEVRYKIKEYKGIFEGRILFPKDTFLISSNFEKKEKKLLNKLKHAKEQALLNLSESAEKEGCNCILNLSIEYDTVGLGGDSFQIVAKGTGVII
ncbi:MAG: heavy metal-binding domain-containing protein [Methanobacteriaceae archaeon]|jgi:uncharacterized protein YbjQ (UPF0145 family)|nr:heavy metal-binding domain-containing protein [Methanobacteriaceae archaeon]